MYQISSATGVVGYTAAPDYCYKLPSGSAQVIGRKERARGEVATGVIFGGVIYNLPGHSEFEGCETATVAEIDEGVVLNEQQRRIAAAEATEADEDALSVDHELRLTMLELGLNE